MSSARPSPSELLAAVRKLKDALAAPRVVETEHGAWIPLTDAAADPVFEVFGRALQAPPETWPPGVPTNLRKICTRQVIYHGDWNDPNQTRQRNLDLAREIEAALTVLLGGPSDSADAAGEGQGRQGGEDTSGSRFELIGDIWHVEFAGEKALIADTLDGLSCCARLLETKHRQVHAFDVEGQQQKVIPRQQSDAPAHDAQAKGEYLRRLAELRQAMKEVEEFEDRSEYDKLKAEEEEILSVLKAGSGLAGRDRRLAGGNESIKATNRVDKAIKGAIKKLRKPAPKTAEHLRKYIKREVDKFAYRPEPPEPVWRVKY
jgi:hypothetical protein